MPKIADKRPNPKSPGQSIRRLVEQNPEPRPEVCSEEDHVIVGGVAYCYCLSRCCYIRGKCHCPRCGCEEHHAVKA